jgi:manganese transport protein
MAGQIVMEGFLRFRIQPWLRRAVTRSLAIIPAALTIYFAGEASTYNLIILSQIILNLQLPFAVIPLVHLTNDKERMGQFANGIWVRLAAWSCAAFILVLNIWLLVDQAKEWIAGSGNYRPLVMALCALGGIAFAALLVIVSCWPMIRKMGENRAAIAKRVSLPLDLSTSLESEIAPVRWNRVYSRILVPLDHSDSDHEAISNALALARMHGARIILLHVEEGVTSQLFGNLASTAEVAEGQDYLADLVAGLRAQNIPVEVVVRHGSSPSHEIVGAIEDLQPDLVVMASHGHSGIKDLIFGTTINSVRHRVKIPMLIVSRT